MYGISTGRKSHSHFGMLTENPRPWWGLWELCFFYLCLFPKFSTMDAYYLVKITKHFFKKKKKGENFTAMFNKKLVIKISIY